MLDMREYAQRVADLTAGHTKEDITEERDWPLRLSLERALEIIGEAANRVPRDVQAQFPQIPWAAIIGMRNILIHGYDTIDLPATLVCGYRERARITPTLGCGYRPTATLRYLNTLFASRR